MLISKWIPFKLQFLRFTRIILAFLLQWIMILVASFEFRYNFPHLLFFRLWCALSAVDFAKQCKEKSSFGVIFQIELLLVKSLWTGPAWCQLIWICWIFMHTESRVEYLPVCHMHVRLQHCMCSVLCSAHSYSHTHSYKLANMKLLHI